uniref:Transmembrane protein 18 n=1 Tax=Rhodnius prolixus TaxID=13249 RepID=T1HUK4_RHOPR
MEATKEIDFNFWAILGSIEWRDPLLIGIILFHIAVTLMKILMNLQRTIGGEKFELIFILGIRDYIYNLEVVIRHFSRLFSRQQYFDSKGMFISLIFSVPILLNCMVMMAIYSITGTVVFKLDVIS